MQTYEAKKNELILETARYYEVAIQFSNDETYQEIRRLLDSVICAITFDELRDYGDKLSTLAPVIHLDARNSAERMKWNWKKRNKSEED